jgi:hypothetical protein
MISSISNLSTMTTRSRTEGKLEVGDPTSCLFHAYICVKIYLYVTVVYILFHKVYVYGARLWNCFSQQVEMAMTKSGAKNAIKKLLGLYYSDSSMTYSLYLASFF